MIHIDYCAWLLTYLTLPCVDMNQSMWIRCTVVDMNHINKIHIYFWYDSIRCESHRPHSFIAWNDHFRYQSHIWMVIWLSMWLTSSFFDPDTPPVTMWFFSMWKHPTIQTILGLRRYVYVPWTSIAKQFKLAQLRAQWPGSLNLIWWCPWLANFFCQAINALSCLCVLWPPGFCILIECTK